MQLKQSLFGLFTITLLSLGGWLTVIFNIDPVSAETFVLVALYSSIFLFIMGITTFLGFGLRVLLGRREVVYAHFGPSLRQGTLLSVALTGLLFLQSLRVLSGIDAGAFLLAIGLIELFFQGKPAVSQPLEED